MNKPFPIIEYAQKLGKNTSELTTSDMVNFMKWWMKQQPRKDILAMPKSYTTKKYEDANTGRLAEQGIESPINNGEEEIVIHTDEVVVEMGLTQADINAVVWALSAVINDYDLEESPYWKPLTDLYDNLVGLRTEEGV